jgi:uncharacterized repeat protein (TIGR03847 family)
MPRHLLEFDNPDRFVPGTVGPPGARTFFLQARQGRALVSVSLEKVQMAALAERLRDLLDAVQPGGAGPDAGGASLTADSLEEPLVDAFRVGTMALGWNPSNERVVIEAIPAETDGEGPEAGAHAGGDAADANLLRVSIAARTAFAFVERAASLLAAGRPTCPFCGEVLGPDGHFCPRTILN